MTQFVFAYNRRNGRLLVDEEFTDGDPAALDRRFELEKQYESEPTIEVVVLSARTREALAATHGRYFHTLSELAELR